MTNPAKILDLDQRLNLVNYGLLDKDYRPTKFAHEFIAFIKLVNGSMGEENTSPVFHYDMLDQLVRPSATKFIQNLYVSFRGSAKTSVLAEYMILYLAVYGRIPNFGTINAILYVSDTIDNGVASMRKQLEYRWDNSEFLRKYLPESGVKFTQDRWSFTNLQGKKLVVLGFGVSPLALTELVYTKDGTKTIGEVQIGEQVYSSDGTLATIANKSEVFHKPMYKITLKDGRSIKVSEDHLNVVVVKGGMGSTVYTKKVLTTLELLTLPLKYHKQRVDKVSYEDSLYVPMCQPLVFDAQDLPVDPYTLGLLLGDGNSRSNGSNKLTGSLKDLDYYITQIPYSLGSVYVDKRHPSVGELPIKGLTESMRSIGVQGVKTYDKFIPVMYKRGSIEQRVALLQGLLDTDGTIDATNKSSRTSFCSTSKQLIEDVKEVVESLGGYTSLRVGKAGEREFKGYTSKTHESYTLSIFLNMNLFRLPRKASKFKTNKLYDKLAITSIEKIDDEPSQCILLDDDSNHEFVTTNYFVTHNTGVRGKKEQGKRPEMAIFDDLMSDKNAQSPTVTRDIKDIIYKAARQALHPKKRLMLWVGTPFNKSDPLYEAASNPAWNTRVYPICEKFPCTREEFKGAWEDRFPYEFVKHEYESLLASGELQGFNQELMLRVMSNESRLVRDGELVWYNTKEVRKKLRDFNVYITTDFATSDHRKADNSVIFVWLYNSNGDLLLIDGMCERQLMDKNVDKLFEFVSIYQPLSVGIEINGQQKGFVSWLRNEMVTRNIYFNLAQQVGSTQEGIRRNKDKLSYLKQFVPRIKAGKVWLPEDLAEEPFMLELLDELRYATQEALKARHDDALDCMTMIQEMVLYKPSNGGGSTKVKTDGVYRSFYPDDDDITAGSTVF